MYNNTETEQLIKFAKSLKKSLTIKYISCKEEAGFIHLNFEVKAQNLKHTDGFLSLYREGVLGFHAEGTAQIVKVSNSISKVTFSFSKYSDSLETAFDKDKNNFYAVIAVDGVSGKSENFKIEIKQGECYCSKQGLTKTSCGGKGKNIVEEMYMNLAKSLNVEKEILLAISKQESGRESFVQNSPKKANILLERHYVYRLLKQKYGKQKADSCKNIDSSLCHEDPTPKGQYGTRLEQLSRLEKVKKWDETIAIESCSWGKFQTMGEYIQEDTTNIYKDAKDFEIAMNMCEVQHFKYFTFFLEKIKGKSLINAMKNKDWENIAYYYNGSHWHTTNPNYATNLKTYYEEFKDR